MPGPQRFTEGSPIHTDLLEAGLDTGFALLRLAATQPARDARRIRKEAAAVCLEGERRLAGWSGPGLRHFRSRFAALRSALERGVPQPAAGARPLPRVLRMPAH